MKPISGAFSLLICTALLAGRTAPAIKETTSSVMSAPAQTAETVVWPDPAIAGNLPERPAPGDDLAAYLNYDWYKNTIIPDGYSVWTSFGKLEDKICSDMIETLKVPGSSTDEQMASALFYSVLDTQARDAAGIGSLKASFDALLSVSSIVELTEFLSSDPVLFNFTPIVVTGVSPDLKNSRVNAANIYAPRLTLGDSAEYAGLTMQGERLKKANDIFYMALLTHNGVSEKEAERMLSDAFEWEKELSRGIYPVETSYREDYYQLIYNEYSPEKLAYLTPDFPLMAVLENAGLGGASRFIVSEPEAMRTMNTAYTEKNLPGIKAYLAMNLLGLTAPYCDSFSAQAQIAWSNSFYGSSGAKPKEIRALELCSSLMGELLGKIYAEKYFDSASKDEITEMVNEIFAAYKQRLSSAAWLTESTRKTAAEKLDAMTLRIGCPEVYRFNWERFDVSRDKALIENAAGIIGETMRQISETADKPVNKELWSMSAHTVNAYYNPSDNSINFPAAILNPPFYIKGGSRSENLGGIGNIIAHEITHAFDTTGSQFDKDGNMSNWWTDADRAAFKERTDLLAARFASIEVVDGEHVRGGLTIGETVADLGAVACTLDIMRGLEQPDYEGYIRAFAGVWAQSITRERRIYTLKYDPHPPNYLRTDVTLQQFQELYDTFEIKEGDFMYVAPEYRIKVW